VSGPVTCELTHSYNPLSRSWESSGRLAVEVSDDARAFLRDASDRVWRTLCFVALRMDPGGKCFVTEDDLARDMGITRAQASKRLKELCEWEHRGSKVLVPDGEGYTLTAFIGNPPLLDGASYATKHETKHEQNETTQSKLEEMPSTQDLIRELTRKLHKIPGVQIQKGNYSLIGRALNTYGYEAVSEAIDDLHYEFDLRDQLGQPMPTNGELGKLLMQRAAWNRKSFETETRGAKENLWDYYGWNEAGDQLVPIKPDPPFTARVIGGKIVIGARPREVEI
jgi:biotin operon repressor